MLRSVFALPRLSHSNKQSFALLPFWRFLFICEQAVLDLYKRSLAPSREVIESTSLSFAGSFVGSMANSSHGAGVGNKASGQAPAVVVACEASLADVLLAGNLPLNLSSADGASSPTSHDSGAMLPQDGPGFGSSHLGNGIFRESYGGASAGSSPLRTRTFSFSELPVLIERLANCGRISSLTSTSSRGKALDKEAPSSNRNEVCWLQCVGGEAALTAMCDLGLRLHSVARRQFKDASPQVGSAVWITFLATVCNIEGFQYRSCVRDLSFDFYLFALLLFSLSFDRPW